MSRPSQVVALIPARAGSKRITGKNVRLLAGHPLLAYTIAAALESGCFSRVVVSSDSPEYLETAERYGAEGLLRPAEMGEDLSPDYEWVRHALDNLVLLSVPDAAFSILRPTSPFRQSLTIRRAVVTFEAAQPCDSLRAVEPVRQHPGKMWQTTPGSRLMHPIWPYTLHWEGHHQYYHSCPTQALPEVLVQNASLEIAWTYVVAKTGTISGQRVARFTTYGYEGLDLNTENDWLLAESLIERGRATLPSIREAKVRWRS